jgi:hypothetical protein
MAYYRATICYPQSPKLKIRRDLAPEPFPDGHRRQAAYGILLCGIQEFTPADLAVDVTIEYAQQLLRKIGRFFPFHLSDSFSRSGRR